MAEFDPRDRLEPAGDVHRPVYRGTCLPGSCRSSLEIDGFGFLFQHPVDLLSLISAGLFNLVSNVPAVLLMEPVLRTMPEASRETAWLALAMSSTFAGNLTILGSMVFTLEPQLTMMMEAVPSLGTGTVLTRCTSLQQRP